VLGPRTAPSPKASPKFRISSLFFPSCMSVCHHAPVIPWPTGTPWDPSPSRHPARIAARKAAWVDDSAGDSCNATLLVTVAAAAGGMCGKPDIKPAGMLIQKLRNQVMSRGWIPYVSFNPSDFPSQHCSYMIIIQIWD